jgi:hypothetical protein
MTSFTVSFIVKTQNVPEVASLSVIRLYIKMIKPNLPRPLKGANLYPLTSQTNPMQPREQVSYFSHFAA